MRALAACIEVEVSGAVFWRVLAAADASLLGLAILVCMCPKAHAYYMLVLCMSRIKDQDTRLTRVCPALRCYRSKGVNKVLSLSLRHRHVGVKGHISHEIEDGLCFSGEPCPREFGGGMNRIVRFWWFIVAFLGTLLMSGRADMFVAL
ncbi:hypothetical protein V8C34DRAFT_292458 [Trichoderma compactum]